MNHILLFLSNREQKVLDIKKYLGMRTQKEESDKSNGEESDTEDSLCHADKSKILMTCPISNKSSTQQRMKCYMKKLGYKKVGEKVYPWVQCEDPPKFVVLLVSNAEGNHQLKMVGG